MNKVNSNIMIMRLALENRGTRYTNSSLIFTHVHKWSVPTRGPMVNISSEKGANIVY